MIELGVSKIPLNLIDDPYIAMRGDFDNDELEDLKRSMREQGLIEPIVVRKLRERYEVIAGHRRTTAARQLSWAVIEAKVVEANEDEVLAMRLAENLDRAETNPVEEANFLGKVMEKYGIDEKSMAERMKRSVEWVRQRLMIFHMPPYMQDQLKQRRYPLGAALWIASITDEDTRLKYAHFAAQDGIGVAGAKYWYEQWKAGQLPVGEQVIAPPEGGAGVPRVILMGVCGKCEKKAPYEEMMSVLVHRGYNCPPEEGTPLVSVPLISDAPLP